MLTLEFTLNSLDKIAVVYKFYNMIQKINSSLDGESRAGPFLYSGPSTTNLRN